jgi:DNA (cytosine-5)-methyltransferase 1
MKKKKYYAADLFCGAGGSSSGLLKAARVLGLDIHLVAVNHWALAIATHSLNHPNVHHINSDLEKVDPLDCVPGGKLDLLIASPECTHFSRARGGKPMSKQSRASAKYILKWISVLDVKSIILENVAEFQDWGPLHRKHSKECVSVSGKCSLKSCIFSTPIKSRKGEYFHRFIAKVKDHGYQVKYRVLNAADYGDPTTRKRLFIMARKDGIPVFPEPSHGRNAVDMFGTRHAWMPARGIIDWNLKGISIFNRKKSLAPNTMRRIMAGLHKFGGKAFVLGQQSGAAPRSVDQPIPTVAGAGAISFIEPFIITTNWTATNRSQPRSMDDPIPTVTGQGSIGLCEPFIIPFFGENKKQSPRSHSIDEPLPTITSQGAGGLVEPFIIQMDQGGAFQDIDKPMKTITSADAWALVDPFLVEYHGGKHGDKRTASLDEPLPTQTTANRFGLAEPYLVEYYGTGAASSVEEPLKTQTGKDRFGLVQPLVFDQNGKRYILDIRFRMLQPNELARAMSFPEGYKFEGSREQVVKQIGNAVPVETAAALCRASLI